MTLWRQLRMIQPTSSATARATRDMPSTRKNAIVFRRLAIRMALSEVSTGLYRVGAFRRIRYAEEVADQFAVATGNNNAHFAKNLKPQAQIRRHTIPSAMTTRSLNSSCPSG